ncbi:MAG: preprotein translocase subunit SecG [Muribaculaceae bacterium]|nr:preprotein translocase subunit SecG [Muribaculaceae bacterium]
MAVTISILICLASILLIGVVLIQKSKGGGLAASASNYNQFMGVRKTTDFVEKATWGLAIFICVLSIASAFLASPKNAQKNANTPDITNMKTTTPQQENAGNAFPTTPAQPGATNQNGGK